MKKHKIITILGFIISIVLLYFSLRGISFKEIAGTLHNADYRLVFVPLVFVAIAVTGCSFRWSRVCGGNVRFRDAITALIIGLFVNNVLPARIGEIARGYVLSKRTGLSLTYSLSTVLADRFFDLVGLLAITFIFFPRETLPPTVSKAILALVLLLIVCVIGMAVMSRRKFAGFIVDALQRIKKPFLSKIALRLLEVQENLKRISSPLNLIGLSAVSLVNWLSMSAALYFVALSVGVTLDFRYVPFVCALLNMGLTIPSSPGYIGVYQFLLTNLLLIFAVPRAEAFTISILFHASWYLPYNIVGAILLVKENLKFKDIRSLEDKESGRP
jgi:glycosyltransferase 2 family protein